MPPAANPSRDQEPAPGEAWGRTGGVVLLVEDEQSIGNLVRSYLQKDGYRVVWVRSGEEALIELARHAVRIVLLDIGLPGMDGFEVCRKMRARSTVPIATRSPIASPGSRSAPTTTSRSRSRRGSSWRG